ncbi:MAG: hypothetical protein ACO1RX_01720 [Candidatus Sericytochromatia bacterium]
MFSNLKKYTAHLSFFVVIAHSLNACSPPQTGQSQKSSSDGAFKLQQITEPDAGDPFYELPSQPDPANDIVVLAADQNVEITTSLKRTFPKNHATGLNHIRLEPAYLPTQVIPAQTKQEVKQLGKATIQEWRRWYRGLFRRMMTTAHEAQRDALQESKAAFDVQLQSVTDNAVRKEKRQQFQAKQAQWRQDFQTQRQDARAVFKQEIQNLPQTVKQYYAEAGFSVQFADLILGLVVGIGLACDVLFNDSRVLKFVGNLVNNISSAKDVVQAAIDQTLNNYTSPPTTASDNGVAGSTNPYAGSTSYNNSIEGENAQRLDAENEVAKVQLAQRIAAQALEMQNNAQLLAQQFGDSFKPILMPFRAQTILENLVDPKTNKPIIDFDPSELSKFSHCSDQAIRNLTSLHIDSCDYALVSSAQSIDWRAFQVNGENIPDWLQLGRPPQQAGADQSLLLTLTYAGNPNSSANGDLEAWLLALLEKKFPETYKRNDEANVTALSEFAKKMKNVYFKIQTPPVCDQKTDLDISSETIVSTQLIAHAPSIVFDGNYSFEMGYTEKAPSEQEQVQRPLASIPVANLTETLEMAAYQLDNANTDVERKPLTMKDTDTRDQKWQKVQISNRTGNLYDLKIEKVGRDLCNLYYRAHCVDAGQMSFQFLTREMETGIYRLSTEYSTATFPDTTPVKGVNANNFAAKGLDVGASLDPFAYDFLISNAAYSTFARTTAFPEEGELYSVLNDSSGNAVFADFKDAKTNLSHVPLDSLLNDPTLYPTDLTDPGTYTPEGNEAYLPGGRLVQEISSRGLANLFNDSTAEPLWKVAQKKNLLADLISNQSQSLKQVSVDPGEGKYLQVGAVVNLHNRNYALNQVLLSNTGARPVKSLPEAASVPMLLQVVDGSGTNVLASWSFRAKLGGHTIVERYWDGQSYPLEEEPEGGLPSYTGGNYSVRVVLDEDFLQQALNKPSGNVEPYFTAMRQDFKNTFVAYPVLSQPNLPVKFDGQEVRSSNVVIAIGESAPVTLTSEQQQWLNWIMNDVDSFKKNYDQLALQFDLTDPSFYVDANLQEFGLAQGGPPPTELIQSDIGQIADNLNRLLNLPCANRPDLCLTLAETTRTQAARVLAQASASEEAFFLAARAFTITTAMLATSATITLLAGPTAAGIQKERGYNIFVGLTKLAEVHKEMLVKLTVERQNCEGVSGERKAQAIKIRRNNRKKISDSLHNLRQMIKYYNRGRQDIGSKYQDALESEGALAGLKVVNIDGEDFFVQPIESLIIDTYTNLIKYAESCDKCFDSAKKKPTIPELECRICRAQPNEREKMEKVLEVRKALSSIPQQGQGGAPNRSVAYGMASTIIKEGNKDVIFTKLFFGHSGLNINYLEDRETDLIQSVANSFGKPSENVYLANIALGQPLFISRKNADKTDGGLQNDAEIKIMETANQYLNNFTIDIFSDRMTCAYCQQVAFRANYPTPGKIKANLKIWTNSDPKPPISIDGKPYYPNENVIASDFGAALKSVENGICQP